MSSENRRNKLVLVLLLVFWVLVLGRLAYVQLVRGAHYRAKAIVQHTDSLRLAADRGRVFDRLGRPLTLNRTGSLVYVWPKKVRCRDSLAEILAQAGLGSESEVRRELVRRDRMFCFKHPIEQPVADTLWRRIVRRRFGNCTAIEKESRRYYPFGKSCANVVGFVGEDGGLAGIEAWYDSVLSGRPGWVLMQLQGSGLEMPYPSYPRVEPVPGADICLTLDADVQEVCYRAIASAVTRTKAKQGSVVVLDARDGAILAMTSSPTFDPADFQDYPAALYKCPPVCDEFEPGSSFKIVVCATALESPNAAEFMSRQYDVSSGEIQVMGRRVSDAHKHGVLDFDGLLVLSSNPGCAMLALELDPEEFYLTARGLGFAEPVGIGLPGEAPGRIDKPKKLNPLRIANNSFGQGVTVTLLQLAGAYLCVANNGSYIRPYLVRSVGAKDRLVHYKNSGSSRSVLHPGTVGRMKDILAKVVTEGTGTFAAVPGVEVCGKTGTAQKVEPGVGYSKTRSVMSFVGFFPKEKPRYVVAVLLDEPVDRFASTSACPVFREVAEDLLTLEQVRQAEQRVKPQMNTDGHGLSSEPGYRSPVGLNRRESAGIAAWAGR